MLNSLSLDSVVNIIKDIKMAQLIYKNEIIKLKNIQQINKYIMLV